MRVAYWNTCPTCGAVAYERCYVRGKRHRATDTHAARIEGQFGPLRGQGEQEWLDRLAQEPAEVRSLLQAAYDAGWMDGMDSGGWA